jgi:hypothetical protein
VSRARRRARPPGRGRQLPRRRLRDHRRRSRRRRRRPRVRQDVDPGAPRRRRGLLARSDILFTPSQSGPPGLGDLDGDGSLDVALATPDGLVTYTSAFGELSPLDIQSPITSSTGAPLDIRLLFRIASLTIGVFAVDHTQLLIGAVDLLAPDRPAIQPPCGARIRRGRPGEPVARPRRRVSGEPRDRCRDRRRGRDDARRG